MTGIKLKPLLSQELPRIKAQHRWYCDVHYTFVCRGRGSSGWGTTPEHAYRVWVRNYQQRLVRWTTRYSGSVRHEAYENVKRQFEVTRLLLRRVK